MGRLVKVKRDEIAKLRKQGYTQKETAEKVKVHLRTVRKYDPLHESRPSGQLSVEDRLATLEEALRTCWDYIHLLKCAMSRFEPLRDKLEKETYPCPRCGGKLKFDDEEVTYICHDCKLKMFPSDDLCYHCFSQGEMDFVEAIGDFVCRRCGAKRYTRSNSVINSSVAGPRLSPRSSP